MADSAHLVYWKNSLQITPVYSLSGYSRAAENTGFYCKELDMAFDAGVQMSDRPAFICLTHLHNDHVCALNKMLIDNPKNPIIFIPNNNKFEELLNQMLRSIYLASKFIHPNSDKGKDPKTRYSYRIVKLAVGQSYLFKETKAVSYYVEGLYSDHGVASISFGIYEMRWRCKPEYQNLERKQYLQLKKNGIDFMETYKYPILCYMSDTSIQPFSKPDILATIIQYPTIVIECTFLEKEDLPQARKKKHIHWEQLEPHVTTHPENRFVLIHFSKKYIWPQVKNFFENVRKEKSLNNIILWTE